MILPAPGRPPDRYGLVFALLMVSFVAATTLGNRPARIATVLLYAAALSLALRFAQVSSRTAWLLRWVLVTGSGIVAALVATVPGRGVEALAALWTAGLLLFTVCVVVMRVLSHRVVSLQTIFGVLSAYLMIGFFYAALFAAIARLDTGPLFADGSRADSATIQYFAFITLTTTGYGDLTPAASAGRGVAVLDALTGQIFLVTLVARLVSLFGTRRPPADDRDVPGR